jgi:hypothetical protein
MIRNINDGMLHDRSKQVVPGTFVHNDIIVPSIAYPNGNPMCPENGFNGYQHSRACNDNPWKNAVVLAVIGSSSGMNSLFRDADHMQDNSWGWGVFYGTDSNSVDQRCMWEPTNKGWNCPGYWQDINGKVTPDNRQTGAGSYPAGNPAADAGKGGGAGCHFSASAKSMDQFDADGVNLVGDYHCQCNYALKNNGWQDWVQQWIQRGKAKPGSSWEKWFEGGKNKAPGWAVDLAACWVSNPRDMIYIQNMVYFYRYTWNNQLVPQSNWDANKPESQRYYWGWNEVPVDSSAVNNPTNFDAIAIKLPAAICPGTNGGQDSVKCLDGSAQNDLQTQLDWYVSNNLLKLGEANMVHRPGSYIVFLREWQITTADTGKWQRYFFCESFNWNKYQAVFKPAAPNYPGECFIDRGTGPAPTPVPPPPPPAPPACIGKAGRFLVNRDQSKCLDISGGKVYNGATLEIWNCNGQAQQNFVWCSDERIVSDKDHSYCIDVPGGDPSKATALQMWSCNGQAGQYWGYDGNNMAVYPTKTGAGENMCLDLAGGSTNPGTAAISYYCKPGQNNEKWFTPSIAQNFSSSENPLLVV